jgi:2-furoyl-CoA dehydrogenase large subunit
MATATKWIGRALPRKEDAALLTGNARFIDDLEPVAGIRHAAMLRSPHAHARIRAIDVSAALDLPGVIAVVTGKDIAATINPIASAVRAPIKYYPIAIEKVRYVGEPVAVVVASDRYVAEDALDLIQVEYEPLPPAVDPKAAMAKDSPLVHEEVGSNIVQRRQFKYGDPDAAFARAHLTVALDSDYPRYSSTPMETYGVIAHFERQPERYTIWANFQGPFILHALMAGALKMAGNRVRIITPPHSGGSFGIKQAIYGYMVLLAAVSRIAGCPVKWIEDRLEHLMASSCAADRADTVEAAFAQDGELLGLRFKNIVNVGAYVRAPEPASVYRMHAASNGAYRVKHIAVENVLVVTNQLPVGLNRGYGGPQFYYSLERAMDTAARRLNIDPAQVRRRNFVRKEEFPYETPGGAHYDAGDYDATLAETLRLAGYDALKTQRDEARAEGRLFGIGFAAGVEPSGSNMAYVTLAHTVEERAKAGAKSGALGVATVSFDPSGAVTVRTASTPNGQGHQTVAAQVVADALGMDPKDITVVTEIDTLTGPWSLASGNYSNRFAAIVVGAVSQAAERVAEKIKLIAANHFEVAPEDIELANGNASVAGVPQKTAPIRRLASQTHWHPAGLPAGMSPGLYETVIMSPEMLGAPDEKERVASAVTYGFVVDLAAVEVERDTGRIHVRKYVSAHDVGNVINPIIVEGQIYGGFAHGIGAALLEEMVYDANGNYQSGTFADYLCPTAPEMPELTIGHVTTPSPTNPLGAKGMGDGSSMLTPAVIANAVTDAIGVENFKLPLTLNKTWDLANGRAPQRVLAAAARLHAAETGERAPGALTGTGEASLSAPPAEVWNLLLDPATLAAIVPGCEKLDLVAADRYAAEVVLGVAGIKGRYKATIELQDKREPHSVRLVGKADGALGFGHGEGRVTLAPAAGGTKLSYSYSADVGGKVAAVGSRMLGAVTRVMIGQFFRGLERKLHPERPGLFGRIFR